MTKQSRAAGERRGRIDVPVLSAAITEFLRARGARQNGAALLFQCAAPDHDDHHPSASWDPAKGLWCCHSQHCHERHGGGGALSLAKLLGIDPEPCRITAPRTHSVSGYRRVRERGGASKDSGLPAAAESRRGAPLSLAALRGRLGATVYEYHAADGSSVGLAIRIDQERGGKRFELWQPATAGLWTPGGIQGPWPLYRLPSLLAAEGPVYLAEGEKCADALAAAGLPGTSCIMGAGKARHTDLSPLKGADVVILPDADDAGTAHAQDLATRLHGVADRVRVLPPFESASVSSKGYDVADWLADGGSAPELVAMASATPDWTPPPMSSGDAGSAEVVGKESRAATLVRIGSAAELFTDGNGRAYATVCRGEVSETHGIRTPAFRAWLGWSYAREMGGQVPTAASIADAVNILEGMAMYEDGAAVHPVYLRHAEHDGRLYIDLGRPGGQTCEVDAEGWRLITDLPVRFKRCAAMVPMPLPEPGGSVDLLRPFVNLSDDDWPLFLVWVLCAMRHRGPFPILILGGEQGSSKSTIMRVAQRLIDPNVAPLRAEPREARDLMISASNGWLLSLDNLDTVPSWLSNALCRLATGGGFAVRSLYSNDEETIFQAMRPVALNGIGEIATRADLLERALFLEPPVIAAAMRRTEAQFWSEFEALAGRIFGALLDALSMALRRLPDLRPLELPRMADAATWAIAAEPALGLREGAIAAALTRHRDDYYAMALESSPVAGTLAQVVGQAAGANMDWVHATAPGGIG